jgi:hypothetical protein
MDGVRFYLLVPVTAPADEGRIYLILRLASECPLRVLSLGKVRMTLRTQDIMMDGRLEFFGIHIGFDEFVILEGYYKAVLSMTRQTGLGLIREICIPCCSRTG